MIKPIENWLKRHRNPTSFALHMVGIPACFVAAPAMLIIRQWWLALGLFAGGYALQFIGHLIEGNKSGEEMLFRRLLGMEKNKKQRGNNP
ncbi:MAG: DUF962 domain-containing protein [Planctomycetes bacterium]|nr:DUF962 domain-containing protein [Planctomycetota bacterium]